MNSPHFRIPKTLNKEEAKKCGNKKASSQGIWFSFRLPFHDLNFMAFFSFFSLPGYSQSALDCNKVHKCRQQPFAFLLVAFRIRQYRTRVGYWISQGVKRHRLTFTSARNIGQKSLINEKGFALDNATLSLD